jgi:crotonobetainyl-CoA:carnitine CoA-transferase CaiB-like acyl-CoA transferase
VLETLVPKTVGPKTVVVEAGRSLAVSYAGALLQDMGFDVTKLAPKTGARHPEARPNRYHPYYDVYDHGKRWQAVEDVRMVTSRLASGLPGGPGRIVIGDRDYLDRELMKELSAGAVAVWFCDAGRGGSGPGRQGELFEALLYFGSGTALFCREGATWPRAPDVPVASLQTGLIGALLAVAVLGGPGTGLIDVSGDLASLVFTSIMYAEEVLGGTKPAELEHRTARGPKGPIDAADGQVQITCVDDRQWTALVRLMGSPRWAASAEYRDPMSRGTNLDVLLQLISQWSQAHSKIELFGILQRERIPAAPSMTVREVLALQFNVEGRLKELSTPGGPTVQLPHTLIGSARPSVSADRSARSWQRHESATPVPGTLPLAGNTVIEWTHAFAGPLAGQLLAQLGANVIKIESVTHPDISRMAPPFAIGGRGSRSLETGTHYLAVNNGKRSIAINLEEPASQRIVRELLSRADAFVTNYSARALNHRRLDPADLQTEFPDLVVTHLTGFGSGRYEEFAAYGPTISMATGLAATMGGGNPAGVMTYWPDMWTGAHAALATVVALNARNLGGPGTTGLGCWTEVSMFDAVLSVLGGYFLTVQTETGCLCGTGHGSAEHPDGASPIRLLRAGGGVRQEWFAVDGTSPGVRALAPEDLADQDARELEDRLTDAGTWFSRLRTPGEVAQTIADGRVRHSAGHPVIGHTEWLDVVPPSLGSTGTSDRAPLLGEHTSSILAGFGFAEPEIADLVSADVVYQDPATTPQYPHPAKRRP